jgi:hypothetical protein
MILTGRGRTNDWASRLGVCQERGQSGRQSPYNLRMGRYGPAVIRVEQHRQQGHEQSQNQSAQCSRRESDACGLFDGSIRIHCLC